MSEEIVKAALASLATVLVAGFVLLGTIISSKKPSKDKPPTGAGHLSEFSGTQNEFMALVVRDNKELRDRQAVLDELMQELKLTVDSIKVHQETFMGAVRRYLMKLATAWAGPGAMPWPDDADFHILEETLPAANLARDTTKHTE